MYAVPLKGRVNSNARLPYGLSVGHVIGAMEDFLKFIEVVNTALAQSQMMPLEQLFMPATFSSIVSEFIARRIPVYCGGLVKNRYPNGYPDLIPAGKYPDDAVQYAEEGIEVKASRRSGGWQGHNIERGWLMVVQFQSAAPGDAQHMPFCFVGVYAAPLSQEDWAFSGRSGESRRTITASVRRSGVKKLRENWLYLDDQ